MKVRPALLALLVLSTPAGPTLHAQTPALSDDSVILEEAKPAEVPPAAPTSAPVVDPVQEEANIIKALPAKEQEKLRELLSDASTFVAGIRLQEAFEKLLEAEAIAPGFIGQDNVAPDTMTHLDFIEGTNPQYQYWDGADDLIWGRLTDGMIVEEGAPIDFSSYIHPRVETEAQKPLADFRYQRAQRGKESREQAAPADEQPRQQAHRRVETAGSNAQARVEQEIIDGAMFGYGKPIGTHFAPHNPDYVDLTGLSNYDPALAKKLLAEAGFPNGFNTTLKLPRPSYARRGAEIIATDNTGKPAR